MLSKNQIKLITSLQQKKYRNKHQLFVAEGIKVVNELLDSDFECKSLFCTSDFGIEKDTENVTVIADKELKKISALKAPNAVLGVFKIPKAKPLKQEGLILALDAVNDPGNLGTIIRLCDWFGVEQLICSLNTVDCYNQKVVQATMGSLARVAVHYVDLKKYLEACSLTIYGAVMQGEHLTAAKLATQGVLVMGNEANGISPEIEPLIHKRITIQRFGKLKQAESLNVSTATAILLHEFRRV